MSIKYRFISALIVFVLLLSTAPVLFAADEWTGWTFPNGATKNSDGTVTITSNGGATVMATKSQGVADEFEIETRIKINQFSGETGFQAITGKRRLFIQLKQNAIDYFVDNGTTTNSRASISYPIGNEWHDYWITVSGNVASIFIDDRFVANIKIQANTGADALRMWAKSAAGASNSMTVEYFRYIVEKEVVELLEPAPVYNDFSSINGWTADNGGVSFEDGHAVLSSDAAGLVQTLTVPVGVSEDFDYEFRLKLKRSYGETGAKLEWNGHRIMMYFYESEGHSVDYFRYLAADGMTGFYFPVQDNVVLKDEWHTWKIEVRGKIGTIYMDGKRLVSYNLPSWSASKPSATFWVKAPDMKDNNHMEIDYAKYTPKLYDFNMISPIDKSVFLEGTNIDFAIDSYEGEINYYANDLLIGSSTNNCFVWDNAASGNYEVYAASKDGLKKSKVINIEVKPAIGIDISTPEKYNYGDKTVVDIVARDVSGSVKRIDFYRDGICVGSTTGSEKRFTYGILPPGVHRLYAVAVNHNGECANSNIVETVITTEINEANSLIDIPGAYTIDFKASGDGTANVNVANSIYGAEILVEQPGDYRFEFDDGAWILYKNNVIISSGKAQRSAEKGVSITENGLKIDNVKLYAQPHQADYFEFYWTDNKLVQPLAGEFAQAYAVSFDLTLGEGSQSFIMNDGAYLIELLFDNSGIYAKNSPLGRNGNIVTEKVAEALEKDKNIALRLQVSRGIAQLFADNKFVASFRAVEQPEVPYINIVNSDNALTTYTSIRKTQDSYVFADDFEGTDNYWTQYGEWNIEDGVMSSEKGNKYTSLLYAFSQNPSMSAKVFVDGKPSTGGVYLVARYNTENVYTRVGYNFEKKAYEIVETCVTDTVHTTVPAEFPTKEWVQAKLELSGKKLVFSINDKVVASTNSLKTGGYGRIGFIADNVAVSVDDVLYNGQGKPMAEVVDFSLMGGHNSDMIRLKDGTLKLSGSGGTTFISKDDGYTWESSDKETYMVGNTLRLKSGALVSIKRVAQPGDNMYLDYAYVSTDDGITWEGPYPVEPVIKNRVTMNGKLTQAENGRVFFAVYEVGHGLEDLGETGVYYSDDDGRTWHASKEYVTIYNTGVNVQESKVVILPDGTPRLYHRTDRGFLYYSDSPDGGYSWDLNLKKSELMSVLCAYSIERDPYTGKYYAIWLYNCKNEDATKQYPRFRIGLAVSDDCEQWNYIMDVDEFDYDLSIKNRFANLGIDIYEDVIYLNSNRFEPVKGNSNQLINRLYRLEKDKLMPLGRFSYVHLRGETEIPPTMQNELSNVFAAYPKNNFFYMGGRMVEYNNASVIAENDSVLIPAQLVARYLGGKYEGGTIIIGSNRETVEAVKVDSVDMLPIEIFEKYNKNYYITDDGLIVIGVSDSNDESMANQITGYIRSAIKR